MDILKFLSNPVTIAVLTPLVAAIIGVIFERLSVNSKSRNQEFYIKRLELIEQLRKVVTNPSTDVKSGMNLFILDNETQGVIDYLQNHSVYDKLGDLYGKDQRNFIAKVFTIRRLSASLVMLWLGIFFYTQLFLSVLFGLIQQIFPNLFVFNYVDIGWKTALVYLVTAIVARTILWFTYYTRYSAQLIQKQKEQTHVNTK